MLSRGLSRISRDLCTLPRRSLTSTSSETPSARQKSHRQEFRELPVLSGTLERVKELGFGEKVRHGRKQRRFHTVDDRLWRRPPPPFQDTRPSVRILDRSEKKVPQIALLGRSNVGKSTLLNAVLYGNRTKDQKFPKGRKAVTSPRPGETRRSTIYDLASFDKKSDQTRWIYRIQLVDLPGYGFSFSQDDLSELVTTFLMAAESKRLNRALLLIDARHGMKHADMEFLRNIESRRKNVVPLQIVLTKCDLVSNPVDLARRVVHVRQQLSDCMQRETSRFPVLLTSVQTGRLRGVYELQRELATLVVPERSDMGSKTS